MISYHYEDRKSDIRLTKLTHTSVHPKALQRQSVPLVIQVFNDKTITAFKALKNKISPSEGTIVFTQMIVDWFKMCNVKDKYASLKNRDELSSPWTPNCSSFTKLEKIVDVVSNCKSEGKTRVKSLTHYTASAFKDSTIFNIEATKHLLQNYSFEYILSAIFS